MAIVSDNSDNILKRVILSAWSQRSTCLRQMSRKSGSRLGVYLNPLTADRQKYSAKVLFKEENDIAVFEMFGHKRGIK